MEKPESDLRVVVVEDDEGIAEHLRHFINFEPGMTCAAVFPSAETALEGVADPPDVVLMDINMPGMSGVECARRMKARSGFAGTQIVMLTVHDDADQIFESLKAGATGYMLKRTAAPAIMAGIRQVAAGGSPMNSEIARKVIQMTVQSPGARGTDERRLSTLTGRESEVLALLAQGKTYKEIAYDLSIHIDTVRNHIRKIYEKLQVNNRTDAVVSYLRRGAPGDAIGED